MPDPGCPRGHVWVTFPNAKVSVCKNCGADQPVFKLPDNDPLMVEKRARAKQEEIARAALNQKE